MVVVLATIAQDHDLAGLRGEPGKAAPLHLCDVLLESGRVAVLIRGEKSDVFAIEAGGVGESIDSVLPTRRDRTISRDDLYEDDQRFLWPHICKDHIRKVLVGLDFETDCICNAVVGHRSEERRGGKECVSKC